MGFPVRRVAVPLAVAVRYCDRELENGGLCGHHLIVHPAEGPCIGFTIRGDRCGCPGFKPPGVAPTADAA